MSTNEEGFFYAISKYRKSKKYYLDELILDIDKFEILDLPRILGEKSGKGNGSLKTLDIKIHLKTAW